MASPLIRPRICGWRSTITVTLAEEDTRCTKACRSCIGRPLEIRELLIDYLSRTKIIPGEASGNWRMTPPDAVAAIEAAADANVAAQTK